MNRSDFFHPALLAACAALAASGCQTGGGGRSSVFQQRRTAPRAAEYGGYGYEVPDDDAGLSPWESPRRASSSPRRGAASSDSRGSAARESARVAELEAAVARLQSQLDATTAAQADVVAQAGASVSRSGAAVDALRPDIATLRAEIEALKAENRALKDEQARQKAQLDELPQKFASIVNAAMPKAAASAPASRKGASQRRATEGWEYTVAAGDTLSAIASGYGVRQADIIRENGLKDANSLRVGQTLFIPKP